MRLIIFDKFILVSCTKSRDFAYGDHDGNIVKEFDQQFKPQN